MARIRLTLLGGFQMRVDDRLVDLPMKKGQALLAYLSIPVGKLMMGGGGTTTEETTAPKSRELPA